MAIINNTKKRTYLLSFLILMLSFSYTYATSYSTSIFADSAKMADSNSYKNSEHHFSLEPPSTWKLLTNVPPDIANNTVAMFSDNRNNHLATLLIFHRTISNQVIDAINNHSDSDILNDLVNEMTAKSPESQTDISKAGIERYTDGTRILIFSSTKYISDNTTTDSANMIYYLNNGDQYTLILTSSPERFDQDVGLFEKSIDSFYVSTNIDNENINIPAWVKNNAKWWSDGTITDTDFVKSIQYMIDSGVIVVPHGQVGSPASKNIPGWVKDNAKWWSDGTITDKEFAKSIEYLINNEILKI